jgi:hypothetical protein
VIQSPIAMVVPSANAIAKSAGEGDAADFNIGT